MKNYLLISVMILTISSCEKENEEPNLNSSDNTFTTSTFTDSTFTDGRDKKVYKIIKYGDQVWLGENLAYKANSGCWAINNNEDLVETYGYLYDWETAKSVIPTGWHLPSDSEWKALIEYIGNDDFVGGKLKSVDLWGNPNVGATNESGFNALPCGFRGANESSDVVGQFVNYGFCTFFWTASSAENSLAWTYGLYNFDSKIWLDKLYRSHGFSVRCVKD